MGIGLIGSVNCEARVRIGGLEAACPASDWKSASQSKSQLVSAGTSSHSGRSLLLDRSRGEKSLSIGCIGLESVTAVSFELSTYSTNVQVGDMVHVIFSTSPPASIYPPRCFPPSSSSAGFSSVLPLRSPLPITITRNTTEPRCRIFIHIIPCASSSVFLPLLILRGFFVKVSPLLRFYSLLPMTRNNSNPVSLAGGFARTRKSLWNADLADEDKNKRGQGGAML